MRVDASAAVFFRNPGRSRCLRFVVLGLHDFSAVMLSCSGVLLREAVTDPADKNIGTWATNKA